MPKVTDAHVEARRQQIMDAARACFSRQGFHQTSIQDICREAGLSAGAVYKYFTSKEHIIAASCLDCQQSAVEHIELARSQGGTALNAIDFLVEYGFGMLDQEGARDFMMMTVHLWSEALRSSEIRSALMTGMVDTWAQEITELFTEAQEQGELDAGMDPKSLSRILNCLWLGLMLHKSLDPDVDVKACVKSFQAMYHRTTKTPVRET